MVTYSPAFIDASNKTLVFEGGELGRENNGQLTRWGIDAGNHPGVNPTTLTMEQARDIYYNSYWLPINGDALPPKTAMVTFDTAINAGVGKANQLLQQSGGDPVAFLQLRQQFYNNLAAQNPADQKYLAGWTNRNNALLTTVGGTAQPNQAAPQTTQATEQSAPSSTAGTPDPFAIPQWSNEDLSKVLLGQAPSFAQQPDPSAFSAPSNGGLGNVPFFGNAASEGAQQQQFNATPQEISSLQAAAGLPVTGVLDEPTKAAFQSASTYLFGDQAKSVYADPKMDMSSIIKSNVGIPESGGFMGLGYLASGAGAKLDKLINGDPTWINPQTKAIEPFPGLSKIFGSDPAALKAAALDGTLTSILAGTPEKPNPTMAALGHVASDVYSPTFGSTETGYAPSPSSNIDFGPAWGKQEGKPEDNPLSDQWKPPALDMTGAMNPFGMGFDLNNAKFNTTPAPNVSLSPATSLYSTTGLGTPGYNAFAGSNLLSGSRPTSQPSQPSSGGAFSLPAPTVGGPLPSWASNLHELNQVATPASFNPMTESIPSNGGSQYDYTIGQNSAGQNVTSWNTGNGVQQILTDVPGGMSYSDAGNPSGETLKAALCSHYMLRGWLDREIWRADTRYSMTLPIEMRVGYQAWAKPLSRWLKSDAIARPLVERMLWPIIRGWSYEMAHRHGAVSRGSLIGKIALATLGPISSAIGRRIISRQLVRI